jgi:CheY-like chemotaxis protein
VVADVSQLRQVLMNLAGNAADALETLPREERGPIRIVARAAEVTPEQLTRARPQALAPGAYLAIDVIDEGPGLAPAIADGLFTPWTTTKSHGHGLGLATSGAILKRHGGGILVDSQPTRTCFTVLLPTSVPTMLPAAEATHTLLFVDPSPLIRRFAVRCLALHRYRVLEAADVQAASALLADHKGVDAVVIDIDASVESHRGPVEALRQLHPALPLIAMGGLRDEVVLTHLRSLRVEQFLLKPFTPKSLLREVEWALARRR